MYPHIRQMHTVQVRPFTRTDLNIPPKLINALRGAIIFFGGKQFLNKLINNFRKNIQGKKKVSIQILNPTFHSRKDLRKLHLSINTSLLGRTNTKVRCFKWQLCMMFKGLRCGGRLPGLISWPFFRLLSSMTLGSFLKLCVHDVFSSIKCSSNKISQGDCEV